MNRDDVGEELDPQFHDWDDRPWRGAMRRFGRAFRAPPCIVLV